jgi:Rrf2 family nitric oxide-sensitive transcriptional repressor
VKIVQDLGQNGFLSTRRGAGGGFTLGRPATEISLGALVRLTESDERVIDCVSKAKVRCRIFPVCRLKSVLSEAAAAFFAVLDRYSLEDLVKRESEMRDLLEI